MLCPLLWVTLLGQGVGLGDPQRSLPTPTMLGFCDSGFQPFPSSEVLLPTDLFIFWGWKEGEKELEP